MYRTGCTPIMKRYLFYYGYIGTRFSGVEYHEKPGVENRTIEKFLKESLQRLDPVNDPVVISASRTDAGVHALCSTFHCDLLLNTLREKKGRKFSNLKKREEDIITSRLNRYFNQYSLDIRIHKTQVVPFTFHCRHSVIRRTYLYRLVHRTNSSKDNASAVKHLHFPISEVYRSYCIEENLDIEAIRAACNLLKGKNDFLNFCKITKKNKYIKTTRTLNEVLITPGRPLFSPVYDTGNEYEDLQFWDVIISARSFLHNQIRRIVGFLIAIGTGKTDLEYLDALLTRKVKWDPSIRIADPHGLYLLNIEYPPEAFIGAHTPSLVESIRGE